MIAEGDGKQQFIPTTKKKKKKKKKKKVRHEDVRPREKHKGKFLNELKNVWTPGLAKAKSSRARGPATGGSVRIKKEEPTEAFDVIPAIPVLSHSEEAAILTDDEDEEYKIQSGGSGPIRLDEFDTCNLEAPEPAQFFHSSRGLENPIIMQLPPVIPLTLFDEVKTVKQEIKNAKSVVLGSATSGFTKTENPLTHPELRNGHIADLVIRESGKVELIFGVGSEKICLDVETGPAARCVEELVSIELGDSRKCNFLGKINPDDHLLCTYNIDQLLKKAW